MTQLGLPLEGADAPRRMAGPCMRCGCDQGLHYKGHGRCMECGCRGYRGQTFEVIDLAHFDPKRLARRRDPEASRKAAENVVRTGLAQNHDGRIVRALLDHLGEPMTAKEIGACTFLTNVQVCRRLGPNGKLRTEGTVRLVPGKGEQRFQAVVR